MGKTVALTGNDAVGIAMKQINPDVVAAFPITPQTELMHKFAEFHANGEVDTELILVESEHSAMSACVGAAASGARVMTATSANGYALMWEIVYIAASLRLPVTMAVVNRALSGPINIHCDHSDSMGGRDSGWIQLFSEDSQEAYDNVIMGVRIAEHPDVRLPALSTLDGFILSHTTERLEVLEDKEVRDFVGTYDPEHTLLDVDHPVTFGPLDLQDYYFEHKRQQVEGMENARRVIPQVFDEFARLSGRKYSYFEAYRMDDAEVVVVVLGSTAGTTKEVVDMLRLEGLKAGMVKLKVFRPFPGRELAEALRNVSAVAVMDRSDSFGALGGPVFTEARSALYELAAHGSNGDSRPSPLSLPKVVNYIYGLGGRDTGIELIRSVYDDLRTIAETGRIKAEKNYLGVRE